MNIINNKVFRQTTALSIGNFFSLLSGFVISLILPKALGSYDYGIFSLVCSIVSFFVVFFEFGIFVSSAKFLLNIKDSKEQDYVIAMAVKILVPIAFLLAGWIYFSSLFIDTILVDKIGVFLMISSYLSVSAILPFVSEQLLKATNQIYKLAIFNLLAKIFYLLFITSGLIFDYLSVKFCCLAFLLSPIVSFYIVFNKYFFLKVERKRYLLNEIININKEFGIKNYLGRVTSTSVQQINRLIIGYFCGAVDVGLFSLSISITTPVYLISQSLSISRFQSFSNRRILSKMFILTHIGIIVFVSGVCLIFAWLLFNCYYKDLYENGMIVISISLLATTVQAGYIPYNDWLAANGLGNEMFLVANIYSILGLVLNFTLIPLYGIYGAVFTLIFMNMYFLLHCVFFYEKNKEKKIE
ncbi:lipopolysaccharide biosynthesis protein [Anaerosinus sp.]|uniref:lipopolysaccharide biosynthesis protein n=1 Tax=Selenobaculum sp. TaxID=3074374 RepID=UPI003AB5B3F4